MRKQLSSSETNLNQKKKLGPNVRTFAKVQPQIML